MAYFAPSLAGDLFFKLLHFGAENKLLAFEDAGDSGENFFTDGGELRFEIQERKWSGDGWLIFLSALLVSCAFR